MQLVDKMNQGFQKMTISDPSKLKAFIEGTTGRTVISLGLDMPSTGSVVAILSSLNSILYTNDPDEIPLTDIDAAAGAIIPRLPCSRPSLRPAL